MPFDDETLLSAYLDDELDPARRQLVEIALRSSPALAGRLHDLAGVRDAVRSLGSPPTPKDLAPGILQRLQDAHDRDRLRKEASRARLRIGLVLTPFVGVAAALLITWSIRGLGVGPEPPVQRNAQTDQPEAAVKVAQTDKSPQAQSSVESADVLPEPVAPEPTPELLAEIDPESEKARLDDQKILREILAQPEAHKILVPVDVVNDDSRKRVEDAIGLTAHTHPRHARLRLYQGVAIDPRHPEQAVVYALVLDSTEAGNLRKNLAKSFPETSVSETDVEPATLAQLSETVHLDVFETTPAGSILASQPPIGDHQLARRSNPDMPRPVVQDVSPEGFSVFNPRRHRAHSPESGPTVASDDAEHPEQRHQDAVYLVWLYEKGRREGSLKD